MSFSGGGEVNSIVKCVFSYNEVLIVFFTMIISWRKYKFDLSLQESFQAGHQRARRMNTEGACRYPSAVCHNLNGHVLGCIHSSTRIWLVPNSPRNPLGLSYGFNLINGACPAVMESSVNLSKLFASWWWQQCPL